jgi:RNA binding exosome subunit
MDKELEKYYNNFFEMFRTEGWKQLLGEVENNVEQTNNLEITKDEQDLYFRKGQLAVFRSLINLEQLMTAAQEQAESEDNEDDAI